MATVYTGRTSVTPTVYTWATAPDIWSAVSDTWATYGTISSGTAWTGRITP